MYNVLIVDDEPIIVQGLSILVDWESCGFKVCSTANSGNEALLKIKENKYHLVVTDIRMPGLDGLELIREIKKMDESIRVIILSGYSEFEYAKRAIQYGVKDYLLKPANSDELINNLKAIKSELDGELEFQDIYLQSSIIARDKFLYDFVNGNLSIKEIDEGIERNQINFEGSIFCAAIVRIESFYEVLQKNVDEAKLLRYGVRNIIDEILQDSNISFIYEEDNDCIGIVFNFEEEKNLQSFMDSLESVNPTVFEYIKTKVRIGIGNFVYSKYDIQVSKKQAQYVVDSISVCKGKEHIICYGQSSIRENDIWEINWNSSKLLVAIEECNIKDVNEYVIALFQEIVEKNINGEKIRVFIWTIILGIRELIKRKAGNSSELLQDELLKRLESGYGNLEETKEIMLQLCINTAQGLIKLVNHRIINIIDQIKNYINENYFEEISLKSISGKFYMNTAYLGQLFKTVSGETFSDYLNGVRIREAKRRFLMGNEKMAVIIEGVGYKSTEYFYRKFKKYEGISFAEFRDKCSIK